MQCTEYKEQLFEVITGEATPEVAAHFTSCQACATELESMRKTMALLDDWKAPEDTSPYFMTRLMARAREEGAKAVPATGWLSWFRKPAFALGMTAVLVAGVALFRNGPVKQQQPDPHNCAVSDLQFLDENEDVLQNLEVLDDMQDGSPNDTGSTVNQ